MATSVGAVMGIIVCVYQSVLVISKKEGISNVERLLQVLSQSNVLHPTTRSNSHTAFNSK